MLALTKPKAGVGSVIRDLTEKLGRFAKISSKNSADEVARITKSVATGSNTIDDIIKSLPVKRAENGLITVGGETVGNINRILREANLTKLIELSKYGKPVTSVEKSLFRELVGDTVERTLKDISDATISSVKTHPKLNIGAESVSKLGKADKAVVDKVQSNLLKRFKEGSIIALAIGSVYVGVDWLVKTTEKRKGCFMVTNINGKTTSCKVSQYTCSDNASSGDLCKSSDMPYYNVTLVLMKIVSLPDNDPNKQTIAKVTGIPVNELQSKLATIIDTKYGEVTDAIADMKNRPSFKVCDISHPSVEKGQIPQCRMCSPGDNPISTTFIDPSQFGSNITFHCSINPSILDTINDVVVSTGQNIWQGVTGNILGPLKNGLIVISIIAVVCFILFGLIKFGLLRNKQKQEIAPANEYQYERLQETYV